MTPHERAEKIVERFISTHEGFAPGDKHALIAAIEQGFNEVLEYAEAKIGLEMFFYEEKRKQFPNLLVLLGMQNAKNIVGAMKTPYSSPKYDYTRPKG